MAPAATLPELHIPQDVLAEVKRKSAETEFDNFRERVLEHFPDAVRVDVNLLADPDEDDRYWVDFWITLPGIFEQSIRERRLQYREDLAEQHSHIEWPLCSLSIQTTLENQ